MHGTVPRSTEERASGHIPRAFDPRPLEVRVILSRFNQSAYVLRVVLHQVFVLGPMPVQRHPLIPSLVSNDGSSGSRINEPRLHPMVTDAMRVGGGAEFPR